MRRLLSTHVISSIYFQPFNKILSRSHIPNIEQTYLIDEKISSTEYLIYSNVLITFVLNPIKNNSPLINVLVFF